MNEQVLYYGANCPCSSDCKRHWNCAERIRFHHGCHYVTRCEFPLNKLQNRGSLSDPLPPAGDR